MKVIHIGVKLSRKNWPSYANQTTCRRLYLDITTWCVRPKSNEITLDLNEFVICCMYRLRTETLWVNVRHGEDDVVGLFRKEAVIDADLSSYRLLVCFTQRRVMVLPTTTAPTDCVVYGSCSLTEFFGRVFSLKMVWFCAVWMVFLSRHPIERPCNDHSSRYMR